MTDAAHVDGDDQGDGPDRLDDRLDDIARLIAGLRDEPDVARRALRRAIALRLLTRAAADALARVEALLYQLGDV